jgi:hypothetical protein
MFVTDVTKFSMSQTCFFGRKHLNFIPEESPNHDSLSAVLSRSYVAGKKGGKEAWQEGLPQPCQSGQDRGKRSRPDVRKRNLSSESLPRGGEKREGEKREGEKHSPRLLRQARMVLRTRASMPRSNRREEAFET